MPCCVSDANPDKKWRRHSALLTETRDPSQRAQSRHEAVLAATHGDEPRQALKTASDRPLGNSEDAVAVVVADERILLGSVADEVAVGHPLRLNKLELPMQVRADQQEDAAALGAVILEHAFRQGWSVVCAAAQKMVEIDSDNVVFQGIARIHTTNVRAKRAFQALHVTRITKIVIAISIRAQCGIVAVRR